MNFQPPVQEEIPKMIQTKSETVIGRSFPVEDCFQRPTIRKIGSEPGNDFSLCFAICRVYYFRVLLPI